MIGCKFSSIVDIVHLMAIKLGIIASRPYLTAEDAEKIDEVLYPHHQNQTRQLISVSEKEREDGTIEETRVYKTCESKLKISGQHNYLNGAAALALVGNLMPEVKIEDLVNQLAEVSLAFGRGEKYRLPGGAVIELVLIKNPASFTQALASYGAAKANLMIAINDNIADGRDVSWLWDVNFESLDAKKVALTSGTRAADMALRLSYDDIKTAEVETDLTKAVNKLAEYAGVWCCL